MTELEQRAAVVGEARTWIRTPFVWEACIKGVGVDCARFLAGVFINTGVKDIDLATYPSLPPGWFLHWQPGQVSYLDLIRTIATEYELAPGQRPRPGDIVVAKQGHDWAHSAIVTEWPAVIGAAYEHCVTEWRDLRQSPQYMNRPLAFLNPWAGGQQG